MSHHMEWFREAKFGMFIHWGLYSLLGRGEWVMHNEGIPAAEYETLMRKFKPRRGCIRDWARLARRAGMRYMVLTTKHHDGFCLFRTRHTDFHALNSAAGRDLVAEYVEAVRAEGLKVGLYFSLGDWNHPAYKAVANGDASQCGKLREFIHGQVRELMTQYGKIDLLWYDGAWFNGGTLSAESLGSAALNDMARQLQPGIIINERAGVPADYVTCENELKPAPFGQDWEMCTCINDMWGYARHDYNYKTVNQLLFLLSNCATNGGNLLLNIGPRANGTVPAPQVQRLEAVGRWLKKQGEAIYGVERLPRVYTSNGRVTRKGSRLYYHVYYWPDREWSIVMSDQAMPGNDGAEPRPLVRLGAPVKASILATGKKLATRWEGNRLILSGLPAVPPDKADTVVVVDL